MFHDEVELTLQSGKGGDGAVSFRREKYIPKGGPDGGDGGDGGDVYITVDPQLSDLNHYASVRELKAENGIPGSGRKLFGRKGADLTISVPVGTRIYRRYPSGWRLLLDLLAPNQPLLLLRGGQGGLGNVHFATATNQAPRQAQPGAPGVQALFKFELQLIADVGIIGLPNAGKSTFLSIVSDAKPKIANYPFTTLSPVLGVIVFHGQRLVAADIPGLIAGAAEGKGLGHTFLRHIKRTNLLLHLIDALSEDYARDYQTVRTELGRFDPALLQKPELVVITKAELITPDIQDDFEAKLTQLKSVIHLPSRLARCGVVSAVTRFNRDALLEELTQVLDKNSKKY